MAKHEPFYSRAVMMTVNSSILFFFFCLLLVSSSVFNYNYDLAIFYDQTDVNNLNLGSYNAWVGLSRTLSGWVWTDGGNLDINHQPFQWWDLLNRNARCAVVTNQQGFDVTDCGEYHFFICHQHGHQGYTFVNQSKTWSDAWQYCRTEYDDLATIRNQNEMDSAVTPQDFPLWTGLHRDGGTWRWSTGLSAYRNWDPNQIGDNGDCVAISSLSKTMTTQNCSARYPFICYRDNLVLVKENKTWEEALKYCKDLTSPNNNPHQLVSVQPRDEYNYMMNKVIEADTDEVWTGLRFLAGNWFWINGADMMFSDLPTRPVPWQHCGAFSKNNTGTLETRDCLDTKNFLCYSRW
ncbi:hypothetical protein Q8A73_002642 [Channa argus]|nr:hypothetical protein Q8A73_002642 [Channa argus]